MGGHHLHLRGRGRLRCRPDPHPGRAGRPGRLADHRREDVDLLRGPGSLPSHRPLPLGPHARSRARRGRPQPVPGSRQHRRRTQRHRHPQAGRKTRPARLADLRDGVRGGAGLVDRDGRPGPGPALHHDRADAADGVGAGSDRRRRRCRCRPRLCRGASPGRRAGRPADGDRRPPGRAAHAGQHGEPCGGGPRPGAGRGGPGRPRHAGDRPGGARRCGGDGRLAAAHRQDLRL